jgi:hypothetical protein
MENLLGGDFDSANLDLRPQIFFGKGLAQPDCGRLRRSHGAVLQRKFVALSGRVSSC